MTKADASTSPLAVGGHDIFGNKSNRGRLADQLVLVRFGIRRDESKHCRAVRRRNPNPSLSGLKAHIKGETESKLIHIESQAAVLIANENPDGVDAEVGIFSIVVLVTLILATVVFATTLGESGLIHQTERKGAGHGDYYKTTKTFRTACVSGRLYGSDM
jgi:hypothetical protein